MPLKVPDNLPAKEILKNESIFIMDESRAFSQDIRPLKIVILNLMPKKEETEVDLLRSLSNSPLQIDVTFAHMGTHESKNTSKEHLSTFYKVIDDISHNKYDGMIITGAPVETLEFDEVSYIDELRRIFEWSKSNVYSTLHICWGAQAALNYHYNIKKYPLEKKLFGVFEHYEVGKRVNLLRGFDDIFYVPHSRHTEIKEADILKNEKLNLVCKSDEAGVNIVTAKRGRQIFIAGHFEYNAQTLANEYFRDLSKGLEIEIPKNYFRDDDPKKNPIVKWRSHCMNLYTNWLNYYVYQETPYDITAIN